MVLRSLLLLLALLFVCGHVLCDQRGLVLSHDVTRVSVGVANQMIITSLEDTNSLQLVFTGGDSMKVLSSPGERNILHKYASTPDSQFALAEDFGGAGTRSLLTGGHDNILLMYSDKLGNREYASPMSSVFDHELVHADVADFNHDGILDIVATTTEGDVVIASGSTKRGTFHPITSVIFSADERARFPADVYTVFAANFNGDHEVDVLAVLNSSVIVLQNRGSVFEAHSFEMTVPPIRVRLGDCNADGLSDIVVLGADHRIRISFNNTRWQSIGGVHASAFSLYDVDRDGALDVVYVDSEDSTMKFAFGRGDCSFEQSDRTEPFDTPANAAVLDVGVADLNGDSRTDAFVLVTPHGSSASNLYVRLGADETAIDTPQTVARVKRGFTPGVYSTAVRYSPWFYNQDQAHGAAVIVYGPDIPPAYPLPTGSVTLSFGGTGEAAYRPTQCGSSGSLTFTINPLNSTTAGQTCTLKFGGPGQFILSAAYSGDSSYDSLTVTGETINIRYPVSLSAAQFPSNLAVNKPMLFSTVAVTNPSSSFTVPTVRWVPQGNNGGDSFLQMLAGLPNKCAESATNNFLVDTSNNFGNCTVTWTHWGGYYMSPAFDGNDYIQSGSTSGGVRMVLYDTTTSLGSGPTSGVRGVEVTFTATVATDPDVSRSMTGAVDFSFAGAGAPSGCAGVALSSNTASCTVTFNTKNSYTPSATYNPSGSCCRSSSVTGSDIVIRHPVTVTVGSSSANPLIDDSVTLTATLTSSVSVPGDVTFSFSPSTGAPTQCGSSGSLTATPSSGVATCVVKFSAADTFTVTADIAQSTDVAAGTGSNSVSISKLTPTVTFDYNPSIPIVNSAATLTATVTSPVAAYTPTGTISLAFVYSGNAPQTGAGSGFTKSVTFTDDGSHNVTVTYGGDSSFNTVAAWSLVSPKWESTVDYTAGSPLSFVTGEDVTLEAQVTVKNPASGAPTSLTGGITFEIVGTNAPTQCGSSGSLVVTPDSSGTARCVVKFTVAGTYSMSVKYAGDSATFASNSPSAMSGVAKHPVAITFPSFGAKTAGSSTTLSATLASAGSLASTVTFSASLITGTGSAGALPSGCSNGNTWVQTIDGSGVATCTLTFPYGRVWRFGASYAGDADTSAKSATSSDITVKDTTSLALTASPTAAQIATSVTYTAKVTTTGDQYGSAAVTFSFSPSTGAPTGCGGSSSLSIASPDAAAGTASCTVTFTTPNSFTVTATYADGAYHVGSTVTASSATVVKYQTSVSFGTSVPTAVVVGDSASITASVATSPTSATVLAGNVVFSFSPSAGAPTSCGGAGGLTVTLSGGVAACTPTFSSSGSFTVTASYSGDAKSLSSSVTSAAIAVAVPTTTPVATTTTQTTTVSSTTQTQQSTTTVSSTTTQQATTQGLVVKLPYCPNAADIEWYRNQGATNLGVTASNLVLLSSPPSSCSGISPPYEVVFAVKDNTGSISTTLANTIADAINSGTISSPAGRPAATAVVRPVSISSTTPSGTSTTKAASDASRLLGSSSISILVATLVGFAVLRC